MKLGLKVKSSLIVLLCIALLNCSSSDDSSDSGDFIRVTAETMAFESVAVTDGATASKIESTNSTTFIVQGFDSSGNVIVIAVPEYEGTGTYELGNSDGTFSASGLFGNETGTWSSVVLGGSGFINIRTDNDEKTTGNFEFIGVNSNDESSTRTVTNGSFSVKFQ